MAEPDEVEEDLFADLYDDDNNATAPQSSSAPVDVPSDPFPKADDGLGYGEEPEVTITTGDEPMDGYGVGHNTNGDAHHQTAFASDMDHHKRESEPFGANVKEDGKMFIGGLNWETTDQSLHDYFSQFGEVAESTVMREASGRSRGFGFLTFKDPRVVNTVMVKEHFLDGKIIDPKRAIPRDEQEKTSKIFVGGVSQDASEGDFTAFFAQFGRVVDATLMMDKDTGRPRGFGFVTFDSEAAVDKCLAYHPLEILGKPIEVKKAQPRGKMGEEDDSRGGRGRGKFGRDDRYGNDNTQSAQGQNAPAQGVTGASGMTPQMMAQYWQRMQQYFAMMQQQMAATAMSGGMGMNPQMMAQMQQMQQMQNMQKQMGGQSPNPAMQQQMMQMMQMQQNGGMGVPGAPTGPGGPPRTGSFSAQEQLAFEQRKYEQQHAKASRGPSNQHRGGGGAGAFNQQQNSSGGSAPQSWEGMYDDVPQPNEGGRASSGGSRTPVSGGPGKAPKGPAAPPPSNAPANAPTGPKNPGKPGANWRGGGRGRFHPYGR